MPYQPSEQGNISLLSTPVLAFLDKIIFMDLISQTNEAIYLTQAQKALPARSGETRRLIRASDDQIQAASTCGMQLKSGDKYCITRFTGY